MKAKKNDEHARVLWNAWNLAVSSEHYASFLPETRTNRAAQNSLRRTITYLEAEAARIGLDLNGDEPEQ